MNDNSLPLAGSLNSSPDSLYTAEATERLARQWTKNMWNGLLWKQVSWLGVPVQQWPTDLILMQQLIFRLRPRVILEAGVYLGGTAVFYSSMLNMMQIDGQVSSVDIAIHPEARVNTANCAYSDRITLLEGDSKSPATHEKIQQLVGGETNVLVCLDSDHSYAHTLAELRVFARYIPVGGYMIMFDTVCEIVADTPSGNPQWATDNPLRAVREFLASQPTDGPQFVIDNDCEKFLVTFCPSGFLRRVR